MRISKLGVKYIKDFAEKAANIFQTYGFYYDGLPGNPAYIPETAKLEEKITRMVQDLSSKYHSITSGRIMVTHWDVEPYFKLWVDLKEMNTTMDEHMDDFNDCPYTGEECIREFLRANTGCIGCDNRNKTTMKGN